MPKRKKLEGRYICKCECGGQVRGIKDFERLFSWCEKCTPVEKVKQPQAGPLMVRHVIDGHEVLLPDDAKLPPRLTPQDNVDLETPLGGTY